MIPLCFMCPSTKPRLGKAQCSKCRHHVCKEHGKRVRGQVMCTGCVAEQVELGVITPTKKTLKEKTP